MKCIDCRFWSEMIAESRGMDDVEAMCLCKESPCEGYMRLETDGCEFWKFNIYGSIDEPGNEKVYDEDDIDP